MARLKDEEHARRLRLCLELAAQNALTLTNIRKLLGVEERAARRWQNRTRAAIHARSRTSRIALASAAAGAREAAAIVREVGDAA